MRLLTFWREGQLRVGALIEDWVVDLNRAYRLWLLEQRDDDELTVADARLPADMLSLLAGGESALDAAWKAAGFRLLEQGRLDLAPLVTHEFPLSGIQQAFELLMEPQAEAIKVAILLD